MLPLVPPVFFRYSSVLVLVFFQVFSCFFSGSGILPLWSKLSLWVFSGFLPLQLWLFSGYLQVIFRFSSVVVVVIFRFSLGFLQVFFGYGSDILLIFF
ncbi:hypothetical protein MOSE0_A02300 [Monosporozyma servazzii]